MKFSLKLLCAILVSVLFLTACSSSLVTLKYEEGKLVNNRQGLSYSAASTTYQPVVIGEAYAYYKKSDMTLYQIEGLDPRDWLTQEYKGSLTTVFYSDNVTLPTLSELGATKIIVCSEDEVTYGVTTIEDQAVIDALIDLFENGENCSCPYSDILCTYEMKPYSEELYPEIYYNLIFSEYAEGKFLYDRYSKRCVNIGTILDSFLPTVE